MRAILSLLLVGLTLAGCAAAPANELDPNGGGPATAAGSGIVLFGVASTSEEPPVHWAIEIRRLDGTGRIEPANGAADANFIVYNQLGGMRDRNSPFAAYSVQPGEYAIVRITAHQPGGLFVDFDHRAAATQAVAMGPMGILAYAVLGTAAAGERAAEEAKFGARQRSPLNFLDDSGGLRAEAPRFTVRAGELVYLGEFLFGATRYFDEWIAPGSGGAREVRTFVSPFVENVADPAAARAAQGRLGVPTWPMRTAQPVSLTRGPLYLAPSMTRDRVDWLSGGTVIGEETVHANPVLARPAAASSVHRAETQNPLPAAVLGHDLQELRRRFLTGEITVEQYRAATARP